jgi:hypothetical protein
MLQLHEILAQKLIFWSQQHNVDERFIVARTGDNTIAVKVTKDRFAAGLYRGVSLLAGVLPKP